MGQTSIREEEKSWILDKYRRFNFDHYNLVAANTKAIFLDKKKNVSHQVSHHPSSSNISNKSIDEEV